MASEPPPSSASSDAPVASLGAYGRIERSIMKEDAKPPAWPIESMITFWFAADAARESTACPAPTPSSS